MQEFKHKDFDNHEKPMTFWDWIAAIGFLVIMLSIIFMPGTRHALKILFGIEL